MKLNIYTLSILFLLLNVRIAALTQADSLESRMASKTGIEKVDALNDLAQYYRNINPQKGLDYAIMALKLSQELNYSVGTADSYTNMGFCHSNLSNFTSAREEHKNALDIRKKTGDKKKIAASLNNIGEALEQLGNNEQAISYFFEAIKIEEEVNDLKGLSTSYSLVATIYYILKQYDKSIEFSEKALSTRQKIDDKEGMANSFELLGLASYSKENTGDALRYHTLALDLRTQLKDKIGMGGSLQNLGMVHKLRKNYPLALEYYGKALALRQETGDKRGIASSFNAMAQIYELQGKDELALDYFLRAFKIRRETNDKRGTASSYHMLADIYKKMGDYKKAYEYLAIFHNYRDSLNAAQSLQKLTAMNYQYKNEKKDQEIALLQKDNIIQRTVRNFVIAGLLFVTIIAVVISLAYRGKKQNNKLLEEKNLEISKREEELIKLNDELKVLNATKDKFFSILAHDLRSPFFGLMGLTEELFKNISEMEKEEIVSFAEIINQSANKLFTLLNNLLDWSAVQSER
ncbi:MAG: tetratricopeptide repeat protein, partial [Syntrophothermus sp.]